MKTSWHENVLHLTDSIWWTCYTTQPIPSILHCQACSKKLASLFMSRPFKHAHSTHHGRKTADHFTTYWTKQMSTFETTPLTHVTYFRSIGNLAETPTVKDQDSPSQQTENAGAKQLRSYFNCPHFHSIFAHTTKQPVVYAALHFRVCCKHVHEQWCNLCSSTASK